MRITPLARIVLAVPVPLAVVIARSNRRLKKGRNASVFARLQGYAITGISAMSEAAIEVIDPNETFERTPDLRRDIAAIALIAITVLLTVSVLICGVVGLCAPYGVVPLLSSSVDVVCWPYLDLCLL